jgi:Tfp pilus tip-associated adhesin PilY1
MNAHSTLSEFARKIGTALILGALAANSHGGATQLATEPFTSSGSLKALPNVMFVLDDSGSMNREFLPDWAGPVLASDNVTVVTPFHRFYNSAFNGVAYNPATYYRPPVMYTGAGALDTATYPSMNGQSVARGGDATATAGSPNWRAVKGDGYGIQNVAPAPATANLEGNAFSYTTVPGEYCTDEKLRTCTASATPTGIYTFPAKLRWCDTSTNALTSTTEAGTRCQAANIANTPTNIAAGVTPYTFARMPGPRKATITVTGTGSVTDITVGGLRILSAATGVGASATAVATAIATNINACTYGLTGICTVVGYSATSLAGVVTVSAPGVTSATPVVTGGTTAAAAFAAPTSPVTSTITVNTAGAITGITVSGAQILSAGTGTGPAVAPVVTGSAATSVPAAFSGTPNISTFTVTGGGVVSSIIVNGQQILATATSSSGTTSTVASRIEAQIDACTAAITGSCTVGGYSASRSGSTITITAPAPVVTGATTTATTFSFGAPNVATITVTGFASSVTNVTVGGLRILSAGTGTAGITTTTLMAAAIVAKINACTAGLSGACTVVGYSASNVGNVVSINAPSNTTAVATQLAANINACTAGVTGSCGVAGYRASSNGNVVTLIAPSATTVTPVVSPNTTTTVTALGYGSVPGASLLTVITSSIASYPFPGTATKAVGRTDCAGTTCTYEEEMTNYANWYAYYRTRMQMMKTAASIAFSTVDDQFRVGYYSINNGSGNDFLNLSAFDGTQKSLWYTKFLNATPFGATPLRTALANTGRLYAGKLSTLNGVAANDPMQYSCQQNFTILSTDGYWNDASNPTQIDGTTEVGNQDHNDPRPYYDGGTQLQTTSQTWRNDEQFASNTRLFEQRTRQQRVTTSQLTQSEVTTTTWPYQLQTTPLQKRITPLTQSTKNLEKRTYSLIDSTRQLQQNETFLQVTTRPLERYTFNPVETTTPLRKTVTNITVTTYQLEQGTQSPQARITQLQVGTQSPQSRTYQLEVKTETVSKLISALQKKTQTINSTTSPLQKTETFIEATTKQLQVMDNVSTDGGDSWHDTAWTNTSSCTANSGQVDTYVRNRRCQYAAPVVTSNQTSCTVVTESPGPTNYTVGLARACAYQAASAPVAVGSCTVRNASATFAATRIQCGYGTAGAAVPGLHSCSAVDQSASSGTNGATLTGNKVVCAYDAASWVAAGSCTDNTPANYSGDKISCQFVDGTPTTVSFPAGPTCVNVPQAGPAYTGDRVTCSYVDPGWVNAATNACTPVTPSPAYSANRVSCQYNGTPSAYADVASCTNYSQATTAAMTGDRVQCRHNPTVSWADALPSGSETCTPNTPANFLTAITSCQYSGTGSYADVGSCTARNQSTSSPMSGDMVECQWNPTTVWTATASCAAPNTPANFSALKTSCRYNPAVKTGPTTGQTTCTPRDQPTSAAMTLDKTVCAWDAASTTTTTSPCTWAVPATPTSPRTTCAYDTAFNTTASPASCTPVPQVNSNTANGQVWSGSIVTCGYAAAVVTTLDPVTGSCTPTGSSAGPPFNSYTTCGWGTGVVATGQTSCTKRNALAGPFTNGAFVACVYQGSATTTNVIAPATCTARAQDTTNYSATGITCSYNTTVVPVTILAPATCSDVPMSSGAGAWTVNVSHSCAYDTTPATVGNGRLFTYSDNISTCTSNRQTTSPYSAPAVDCTYSASATPSTPASCTRNAPQSGPSGTTFTGADITCGYGAPGSWNVVPAASTCTIKTQTATPGVTGTNFVPAVECAYNGTRVDTLVDNTCAAVPGESGTADGTVYSTLQKKVCVAGSFPSVAAPVVSTPVNACNTTPVHTNLANAVYTDKATTCTYLAPVTVNAGTAGGGALPCVPVAASTGPAYVTSVSCPVTDTNWVPVTTSPLNTSCVTSGTPEPAPLVFDATTGKIVQCRNSDTTVYNATFPSGPVAVPSCTWTANPTVTDNTTTGVQTTCVKPDASVAFPTINMDPAPTDPSTCNATVTPVAPAYIWTRCNPITSSATVRGCNPVAPTSPLWETKTCADDGTGTRNTLADVAAYYYKTDLRTNALNNCSGATLPATGLQGVLCTATKAMNNVPTTPSDPNSAQHMTTFTLGLGASGYMQYSSTYPTDTSGDFYTVKGVAPYLPDNGIVANPASGVCAWQSTNLCNWPLPVSDEQTTIDDLWHAGINGHGAYFSATDPTSLSTSLASALQGVAATGGSGASPTASNASIKQGDNYFFNSNYTTLEWTGELVRKQINPITAEASTAVDWSAQAKLDNKPWATRAIWTFDNSVATTKLKAFNSTNFAANSYFLSPHISAAPNGLTQYLCASASICLSATDQDASHAAGANLVNYLAGDRSNEGAETNNSKYYRQRTHVLGDLVNAQVVYVNKPQYNYADPGYDAFIVSQGSRVATLYAGANDGMLHAFRAKGSVATENLVTAAATAVNAAVLDQSNAALATAAAAAVTASVAAVAADTLIGQEIWTYIPTMVFPHLYKLADKNYKNKHRYYVDGSPVSADICTSNCSVGAATWKTILVGGLGRGGRGYYALDVTDPTSPKALWEFTDTNLGYSFGSPQIGKLGDGTWVVLVSSGYNNIPNEDGAGGDGVGRLFVINATDGTLIRSISTGVGDTSDPSGLAKITAQVINPDSDNTIEAVYGGDLLGNLWRFDVNNNIGAAGFDAQLMASLKDGAGNPQPITTKPQVTSIPATGEKLIIIGTGSYLALSDASNTNTQSVYALKDPRTAGGTAGTAIFDNPGGSPRVTGTSTAGFVRQIYTEETCPAGTSPSICCPIGTAPEICEAVNTGPPGELVRTATANPVDFATQNGWFFDLVTTSERANTDIALGLGALVINTNVPSVEACEVGGTSYQYDLNYLTGAAIGATSSSPLSKRVVGKQLANQLASSPILLMTASGKLVALSGLAGGGVSIQLPTLPPGASISRRTSWRELIRE